MKAQRLRFRYSIQPPAAGLGNRELISIWEQAAEAAGLSVSYSEGKRPAPQIALAAPLPQNVTSGWELIDIYLSEPARAAKAPAMISPHLPPGIEALAVEEVGVSAPSLQSSLRWAEYEVRVPGAGLSESDVCARIQALEAADSLPWEHSRETKVRKYDLRPLVLALSLKASEEGCFVLQMKLRAQPEMTARADQVVAALGLPEAERIHRQRLCLEVVQPAVSAYRRLGEPQETQS